VARTPQRTVSLPRSTPARQVAVGARGGARSPGTVVRHLLATPSSREADATRARVVAAALRGTPGGRGGPRPRVLTVGEQRLLQVSRVVATGAQVLLLDEPAAGMTAAERVRLARVLRLLAGNGSAVLLVEHDMRLVGAVADRVTVLRPRPGARRGDARAGAGGPGGAAGVPRREGHGEDAAGGGRPPAAAGLRGRRHGGAEALFVVSAPLTAQPWVGEFVQRGAELAAAELNATAASTAARSSSRCSTTAGSPQRAVANARTAVSRGATALITDGVGGGRRRRGHRPGARCAVFRRGPSEGASRSSTRRSARRCLPARAPRPTRR
jgi:hypothetical protein